jgi:type I restriction enzyme S subunit
MRPYVRAANVTWSGLSLDDVKEMHFSADEVERFRLWPGDVLMSEASGSADEVGKVALWRGEITDCCFQNTLIRLRGRGATDPRFLLYRMQFEALMGSWTDEIARGVGIHHIGSRRLESWEFDLPPLDEQERIADEIEQRFSHLEVAARDVGRVGVKLGLADAAVLADAVRPASNGRQLTLSELTDPERTSAYGVLQPGDHVPGGVPLVRVGDLTEGTVAGDLKRIHPTVSAQYNRTVLRGGELLVSVVGTIGRTAVAPSHLAGANVARAVAVFPVNAELCSAAWLSIVLSAEPHRSRLRGSAHEVARQTLNLGDLRSFVVPVPPLLEQRRVEVDVATRRGVLTACKETARRTSGRLETVRRAILRDAFAGRLRLTEDRLRLVTFDASHQAGRLEEHSARATEDAKT